MEGEELAVSELGHEKGQNLEAGVPESQYCEYRWDLHLMAEKKGELEVWSDGGSLGQSCQLRQQALRR